MPFSGILNVFKNAANAVYAMRLIMALAWTFTTAAAHAADVDHIYIDDYRLQISCEGFGTPTVIMDSGLGGSSLEWVFVSIRLRDVTRVCTYDRAGYGSSDMGPMPRTSSKIANELFLLLEDARVSPPFILVGHSFGGYNTQLFARRYPYLSAGLVLVDASHPDQVKRFLAPPLNMITAPSSRYGIAKFRDPPPPHVGLPDNLRRQISQRAVRWKTRRTLASELLNFRESAVQLKNSRPLHDLPVIVVTRGKIDGEINEQRLQAEKLWLELQSDLASISPISAHLVAIKSGHNIHIDQPDLVAFAISLLIDRYRARASNGDEFAYFDHAGRDHFTLTDAVWLKDTLSLYPDSALVDASASMCTTGTELYCEAHMDGAP